MILAEKMVGEADHLIEHATNGYFLASSGSSKARRGRELCEEWLSETFRAEFTKACLGDAGASSPRRGPRQTAKGTAAAAFFPGQGMTKEEAETFITGLSPINDSHGMPSRRRYFRPDGAVIAEAEWVSKWAIDEAGSPLLTMFEAEAAELDAKGGRERVNGEQLERWHGYSHLGGSRLGGVATCGHGDERTRSEDNLGPGRASADTFSGQYGEMN